jgi:hypothetical protein
MFGGTELDTAYPGRQSKHEHFESIHTVREEDSNINKQTIGNPTYNPSVAIESTHGLQLESDTKQQINELQYQLKRQKELNALMQKDVASIYDRFASKKKDVLKLVNVSLTVLLAISIHFVMSDLIKGYIMNNDFSSNKETLIKCSYPIAIFILMWSMKVFNR